MKNRVSLIFGLILVLGLSTVVSAASVTPVLYEVWVSGDADFECGQIDGDYDFAYKVEPWDGDDPSGDYTHEGQTITITAYGGGGEYPTFDWAVSPYSLGAVIVKAGTSALVYYYDGVSSDSDLDAPGGRAVSHATFCWNATTDYEELTVSKTAETSYTRTHEWSIDKSVETDFGY
jgi:hypothetical protein